MNEISEILFPVVNYGISAKKNRFQRNTLVIAKKPIVCLLWSMTDQCSEEYLLIPILFI